MSVATRPVLARSSGFPIDLQNDLRCRMNFVNPHTYVCPAQGGDPGLLNTGGTALPCSTTPQSIC